MYSFNIQTRERKELFDSRFLLIRLGVYDDAIQTLDQTVQARLLSFFQNSGRCFPEVLVTIGEIARQNPSTSRAFVISHVRMNLPARWTYQFSHLVTLNTSNLADKTGQIQIADSSIAATFYG